MLSCLVSLEVTESKQEREHQEVALENSISVTNHVMGGAHLRMLEPLCWGPKPAPTLPSTLEWSSHKPSPSLQSAGATTHIYAAD